MIKRIKKEILWLLPKKTTHKFIYRRKFGKKLDLKNPKNLNEKIQYLIVYKYGKKEANLADKIQVKDYIKNYDIDSLHIPKTLKTYSNPKDIILDELPEKFVLKCNHGSGSIFVCKDKKTFDLEKAKKELAKALKENFAKRNFEYHYKYIKPYILAEEFLDDGSGKVPTDYKFYVMNGKVNRILVCTDRENGLHKENYSADWKKLNDNMPKYTTNIMAPKPKNLKRMVEISEKLCKDKNGKVVIPFARVDLYNINGEVYFGEYTFTPARGLISYCKEETLLEMGKALDLSKYNKGAK